MLDITVIGGGLGGLISSILLRKKGFEVLLIEKNTYPFHRVCGEYISNEVIPFLEANDLFPIDLGPASINRLLISATGGSHFKTQLDLGGFGISRYQFDQWLAQKASDIGVTIVHDTAQSITKKDSWVVVTKKGLHYPSKILISAHGKRAKLDQELNRPFLKHRSPFVGVKYHVKSSFATDTIALHNFKAGYCGFSKIEGDLYNLCYMVHRDQVRKHSSIHELEQKVLLKNPWLQEIWCNSEFVFDTPKVINEITFHAKEPLHNNILMVGDAAGMITPLAGNGMALAIRSAALLSSVINENYDSGAFDEVGIAEQYQQAWDRHFKVHLWKGRVIQKVFFSNPFSSSLAVFSGKYFKNVTNSIIQQTHGDPFTEISAR